MAVVKNSRTFQGENLIFFVFKNLLLKNFAIFQDFVKMCEPNVLKRTATGLCMKFKIF